MPALSNHTTCTVSEGGTVYFSCVVYDTCNAIIVVWFKSRNIRGNSQRITRSPEQGGKYQIFDVHVTANDSNLDGYCSTASFLAINNFNHTNDSGYYFCQISVDGRLLLPSPYGYVSVNEDSDRPCGVGDFNNYLSPRLCAEYPLSEPTESLSSISTTNHSSESTQQEYNESKSVIARTTLSGSTITKESGTGLLYGTIIGTLLFVIVLILMILLCTSMAIVWYRNRQKRGKLSCVVHVYS